jgi:hypothetical protein
VRVKKQLLVYATPDRQKGEARVLKTGAWEGVKNKALTRGRSKIDAVDMFSSSSQGLILLLKDLEAAGSTTESMTWITQRQS